MMKRARLSYENWTCITDRKISVKRVEEAAFTGHVVLIDILRVDGPQTWQVDGLAGDISALKALTNAAMRWAKAGNTPCLHE